MQSDHGHEVPNAGGNDGDEAAWLDLVARLQEPADAFMESALDTADDGGEGGGPAAAGPDDGGAGGSPAGGPDAGPQKGVVDFDPLGVWQRSTDPAPAEPGYGEGFSEGGGARNGGPRDYEADGLPDEFVPEELPSLAGADPAIMLSWIGAAGGPIFLVLAAIFWRGIQLLAVIGVIVAFLAGTGYLLYRLPNHRDHDDGDGAVV
ncbi:hypothetical protein [Arthrobacter sp. A2-55]|uniref:hypothetical protein n=1 Tax=Arthrobacter sp. A2-55 TaxID=2897337 RepID=UPI0021CDB803|nr:hypothetical protein [Arthrobacter sp. A2-55]MCU6479168.1 hypothetical protein [Arthrobacter sp. A2-55]